MSLPLLKNPYWRESFLPVTVTQYHALLEQGLIPEKSELLFGLIVKKMTKSPRHVFITSQLFEFLRRSLPPGLLLRKEEPLTLADSEPEPDLAIVAGDARDFRKQHPATARLVVEVAIQSLEGDREKARLYAAAGVEEYWLVDGKGESLRVYREPSKNEYRSLVKMPFAEVFFSGVLEREVCLADILAGE